MESDLVNEETGKIALAAFLASVVLFTAFQGFRVEEANSKCSRVIEICHGVPFNGCIGQKSSKTLFVEKNRCRLIDNITRTCRSLKSAVCSMEKFSEDKWYQKAEAFGKSCAIWKKEYNLDFSSC
ncbi:MAG: hypothetical protein ABEJ72_01295 [Candidatus Aenigmatarchaeota archaeon]